MVVSQGFVFLGGEVVVVGGAEMMGFVFGAAPLNLMVYPVANSSHLKMGAPWKRRFLLETVIEV